MKETVVLRNKPELKIILNAEEFEIIDASDPKNSGVYLLGQIKSVELNAERTDWFISTLSWIIGLFTESAIGGKFRNKANLKLKMVNRTITIWLVDVNFRNAKRITKLIKNKTLYKKAS